ncbi:MAG: hypothetical protein IBJ09_14500 [Bacteroidia bacterium]|nr:hypothetical protein [Bacteroidia bacterium]
MRTIKSLLAVSAVLVFFAACKKDKGPDLADRTLYLPVDIGHQYEYQIDSMYWTTDSSGSVSYMYRETYETDVPDNTGGLQTRIKTERRGGNAAGYTVLGYDYIQKYYNKNQKEWTVELLKNNIRYIMLLAPIENGDSLNRNAKNLALAQYWTASLIEKSGSYGGQNYEHTLTLIETEQSDSVYIITNKEVYAHSVGLVYKEDTYIKGKTNVPNWQNIPVEQRIEYGYKYTKELKSHADLY